MVNTICTIIKRARDISLEAGIEKYKSYFVNITNWQKYRSAVDEKLTADGYTDCIVITE